MRAAEITDTRTPLWRMTDEQLRFYVQDDLTPWDRRKTAEMILALRHPDTALGATEDDGA